MRSERRSRRQWRALFKQQEESGLSAAEFCRNNNIYLQTFYARRSDISHRAQRSFVKVEREVTTEVVQRDTEALMTLTYGQSQLSLPQQTDPAWLARLLKGLA